MMTQTLTTPLRASLNTRRAHPDIANYVIPKMRHAQERGALIADQYPLTVEVVPGSKAMTVYVPDTEDTLSALNLVSDELGRAGTNAHSLYSVSVIDRVTLLLCPQDWFPDALTQDQTDDPEDGDSFSMG